MTADPRTEPGPPPSAVEWRPGLCTICGARGDVWMGTYTFRGTTYAVRVGVHDCSLEIA